MGGTEDDSRARLWWAELARLAASSGYTSGSFPIYRPKFRFFDQDHSYWDSSLNDWAALGPPAVLDDGKVARLRLTGAQGLSSKGLTALIEFQPKKGAGRVTLAASAITTADEGGTALVEFPSILGAMKADTKVAVNLSYRRSLFRWSNPDLDSTWEWHRDDLTVISMKGNDGKKDELDPGFNIEVSSRSIRSVGRGSGQFALVFRKGKGTAAKKLTDVVFSISGAHLISAEPNFVAHRGDFQASVDTRHLLTLGGLVPGSVVRVEAWRLKTVESKDGKKPGPPKKVSAEPVEIAVVGPEITEEER